MILDLVQVDRPGPNPLGRPRLEPPLIKLLIVDCHDTCNAAPRFCSGNNGESAIRDGPSEVVVDESNAVSV